MGVKEFIYYLLEHGRQLIKHSPHSQFRPGVAILSSLFNFPCDFKDGKCANKSRSIRCCCTNCAHCLGHFEGYWPCDTHLLADYARRFTSKNGFWRPGKGCILPRHMRSLTCAFYICSNIKKEFEKRNNDDILNLRQVIGHYTDSSYRYGSGRDGQYAKDIIKTERDLDKTVADFLWKRNLFYDSPHKKLVGITKKKRGSGGWIELTLEGGWEISCSRK